MAGNLDQAQRGLHGVIAAIPTAVDPKGEPDCGRSVALARFLLVNGCDGLNVLGTTGEATSFSLDQRRRVMNAYAEAGLPLVRMMVGTGAAALADAIALTEHAAELGFAGALVLRGYRMMVLSRSSRLFCRQLPRDPFRFTSII